MQPFAFSYCLCEECNLDWSMVLYFSTACVKNITACVKNLDWSLVLHFPPACVIPYCLSEEHADCVKNLDWSLVLHFPTAYMKNTT